MDLLAEYAKAVGCAQVSIDSIMSNKDTREIFVDSALQQVALYEDTAGQLLYLILDTYIVSNTIQ